MPLRIGDLLRNARIVAVASHDGPITEDEAVEISNGLVEFVDELGEEVYWQGKEERALLTGIEWAIRLCSREAKGARSSGAVCHYEDWLDDPSNPCTWLLHTEVRVFPEESFDFNVRRAALSCARFLVSTAEQAGAERAELDKQLVKSMYRIWQNSHEDRSGAVVLAMVNAGIKRMLYVARRAVEIEYATSSTSRSYRLQDYRSLLALYRILCTLIHENADDEFYVPPLPF